MSEQWDRSRIAEHGATDADLPSFQLGYTDVAVHLADSDLRGEFSRRGIYVAKGHRSLTNKFEPGARRFLEAAAEVFFALHKPILGWWQPQYGGVQLWVHSNGVADAEAVVRLPEQLSSDDRIFSTLAALHHGDPQAQAAYAQARSQFIVAASAVPGWELYVNDHGLIDVRR